MVIRAGAKRRWLVLGWSGLGVLFGLAPSWALGLDAVSVVDETVEHSVGDCRVSEIVVPLFDR